MEKSGSKQFKVNTKGTCFICFKKLKPAVIIRTVDFSSSSDDEEVIRETKREKWVTSSLKTLCTYLKVNMEKVFSSDSAMPSHLLEELRKAEVKATLCLECRKYVEKMQNLLMELDKVKLQLGNCLKNIHDKLMEAEEEGVKQKYWDEMLGNSRALMHVAVVEKLRKEVLEKCLCVVKNASPKVKLERLKPVSHAKRVTEVKAVDEQIVTLSSDSDSDNPSSSDDDKPLAVRVGRRVLHSSSSSSSSSIPSSSDSSDDEMSSTVNSRRSSFSVDTNPDPPSTGDVSLNSTQKTPKDDPVKRLYPFKCKVCRRRFRNEEKFNTHDHNEPPKIQSISDLVLEDVANATQTFSSSQQQMHINKKKNPEKQKKLALSQKSPKKRLQIVKTALKTLKNQKKVNRNIGKKNTPEYFSLRDLVKEGKEGRKEGNPAAGTRKRFTCSQCPNQYTRLHDLNRHFQKIHTVQINTPNFNGAQQLEQLHFHQVQTNSELLNIPEDNFEIERILPDDGEDDDMKVVTVTEEIDLHITAETEQFIQEVTRLPSNLLMQPLVYNASDLGCSSSAISIENESNSIGWTPIGHRLQFAAEDDQDDDNEAQCTLPFEEISNDDVKMDTDLEKALEPIIILDTDDDADDATKIEEKTLPCLPMQV